MVIKLKTTHLWVKNIHIYIYILHKELKNDVENITLRIHTMPLLPDYQTIGGRARGQLQQ